MDPIPEEGSTVYAISGSCGRALVHLPNCGVISQDQQAENILHASHQTADNGRLGHSCPQLTCPECRILCRAFPAQKLVLYSEKVLEENVAIFKSILCNFIFLETSFPLKRFIQNVYFEIKLFMEKLLKELFI